MRGTGHSRAIDCRDLQRGLGPDELGVAQCARSSATASGSYRTAAAADDLDGGAAALGFGRIDLYGDSYGTYLAESYAFRHGDTLEALVARQRLSACAARAAGTRVCGEPGSGRWRPSAGASPAAAAMRRGG